MKKLLLACIFLAVLALPAFADGPLRVAGSLDFGDTFGSGIGISAHVVYAPSIVDRILRLGAGATFQLPLGDVSQLAIYGTAYWFPIPTFVQDKKVEWYDKWYLKLNLGFNIPLITNADVYSDSKGGFYNGWGMGYEVTDTFFIEFIRSIFAWTWGTGSYRYSWGQYVWHLTFGVKL